MSTLILHLPDEVTAELAAAGRALRKSPEEIAGELLRRALLVRRFAALRDLFIRSLGEEAHERRRRFQAGLVKIVFDTNVLLAALISRQGVCASMVQTCIVRHALFISQVILDELRRNLASKGKLPPAQIDAALRLFRDAATLVAPAPVAAGTCRDPDDLPILGTAVAAGAEVLVTGDEDLLVLGQHDGIIILSPRQFHDRYLADAPDEAGHAGAGPTGQ